MVRRRWSYFGGYVAAALALGVFYAMRRQDLLADTPYWLVAAFLAAACLVDVIGRLLQRRHPGSIGWDRFRVASSAATTALVLYATGWGSVLIIGFAVGATQVLGPAERPEWRWAYGTSVVAVACGEMAIALGIAPTLIEARLAHAIAVVGLLCLWVVLWTLGEALQHAKTNRQEVLEREDRLLLLATTDSLTGLPNRTLFNDRLDLALKRLDRSAGLLAVLVVDLDDFKNVNDSLGHLAGDELLVAVADRFRARLRGFDTIARVGGDEFAILVDGLTDQRGAELVAERVREALAEPLHFTDRTASIDASIGIALAGHASTPPRTLLGQADAAMYLTKREGKGGHRVFETAMQVAAVERLNLEEELRDALADARITAHYQPIVDSITGTVTGFEALARWPHEQRGMVLPHTFISIAEDSGLILDVGRAVLAEACEIAQRWHEEFRLLRPTVSVNVSRVQLADPRFVDDVVVALTDTRLEPAALVLEVTESVLARDPDRMAARLNELRRLGIRVAIDDFGTGYSSFAALAELPIDILKIDKRFTDRVQRDAEGRGFVMAILQLAETLGLETIAEGVERAEQRDALTELGCTHIQGFLYSPPMPGDLTHDYLAASLDRPEPLVTR